MIINSGNSGKIKIDKLEVEVDKLSKTKIEIDIDKAMIFFTVDIIIHWALKPYAIT